MLEASCRPEELEALRRERAELEKKLGYEKYRAEEATPPPLDLEEEAENRACEREFRRRLKAVLKREPRLCSRS